MRCYLVLQWILATKFHVAYLSHILDDLFFGSTRNTVCNLDMKSFLMFLAAVLCMPVCILMPVGLVLLLS